MLKQSKRHEAAIVVGHVQPSPQEGVPNNNYLRMKSVFDFHPLLL